MTAHPKIKHPDAVFGASTEPAPVPASKVTTEVAPKVEALLDDRAFFRSVVERVTNADLAAIPPAGYDDVLETMEVVRCAITQAAADLAAAEAAIARQEQALAARSASLDERERALETRLRAVRLREELTPADDEPAGQAPRPRHRRFTLPGWGR